MLNVIAVPTAPEAARAVRDRPDALIAVPLPDDAEVRGDWVRAPGARGGALIYVHGGGFAHTMPEAERVMAYRLSKATGRPALRVDYRLAPRHPYPAALEDVLAAWRSVLDAGVPAAEVVLAGESAGATLVLSALLEIRRTGGPQPGAAVAVSPVTDFALTGASLSANDGKDVMNRAALDSLRARYLAGAPADRAPQSPLYGDLRGLPPLLIAVGAHEILLDDARRFAEAAGAAGVSVRLEEYADMPHAFHLSERGEVLLDRIGRWLAEQVRDVGVDDVSVSDARGRDVRGCDARGRDVTGRDVSVSDFTVSDPAAGPYALTEGPDGALWFTLVHQGAIGRRGADGRITVHSVGAKPMMIAQGPDGALWFTEYGTHRIGRITVDGAVSSFVPPTAGGGPYGIAAGPDGAMWFTLSAADRIGRITMDGDITEYPASGVTEPRAPGATQHPAPRTFPSAMAAGPDGAMWFTLNQGNAIGRITMDGLTTAHPLPTEAAAPVGIAQGPDGALWFTEIGAGQIGRITVDGTVTEYPLPDRQARPHAVTGGPDGALWFTEWGRGGVGRITTDGRITAYDLPRADCEPHGIAAYDGALWCALETGSLARIEVPR
ncbi:alpha/beta hydrolase fold domain-containing protein [Streptomyces sp. SID8382]|nr:Virginiamycin B lyase [Streptomyces sp. M56]MYX63207.1 alpha/beta hydrolase fold domain-containing protein [Streptomyces sp. SID8382]